MSARTDAEAEQNQATTGVTPDTLGATLKAKLEASHVDIQDLSGALSKRVEDLEMSNSNVQAVAARCSRQS